MELPQAIVDAAVREFTRTSGNVSLWDRMNKILELAADDIVKYAMDVQVHTRHVSRCTGCGGAGPDPCPACGIMK